MRRLSCGAVFAIALLAACGGGGGGSSSAPGPLPPAPTQTAMAAPQGFASSNAVAIPSAAPGATTVPVALSSDATGASANAALPAAANVSADTTIAVTYTSTADPSLPALSSRRSVRARTARDDSTKTNALAYLKLQFSADLNLPQAPGFTFTVPGTIATQGVAYWLAFYDPLRAAAGWQEGFEGPATVTQATVNGHSATQFTFASNGQPLSFVANQTYWFAVIAIVTTAASPTPVPTTVPTNAPPSGKPAPVLSTPRNIQFSSLTDAPKQVTFVESGYAGTFELHGDCTGIVNTTGASPTFTVTPVGQGRCVIVGLGDRGSSAVVHVGVVTPYETPHPTPSAEPSHSPEPTRSPTASPSAEPSHSPEPSESPEPTHAPTTAPTGEPSHSPTVSPTPEPSHSPTSTSTPSSSPTPFPSQSPGTH